MEKKFFFHTPCYLEPKNRKMKSIVWIYISTSNYSGKIISKNEEHNLDKKDTLKIFSLFASEVYNRYLKNDKDQ